MWLHMCKLIPHTLLQVYMFFLKLSRGAHINFSTFNQKWANEIFQRNKYRKISGVKSQLNWNVTSITQEFNEINFNMYIHLPPYTLTMYVYYTADPHIHSQICSYKWPPYIEQTSHSYIFIDSSTSRRLIC